eukprot:358262-Chlamydomonas_euryale.AAC.10
MCDRLQRRRQQWLQGSYGASYLSRAHDIGGHTTGLAFFPEAFFPRGPFPEAFFLGGPFPEAAAVEAGMAK